MCQDDEAHRSVSKWSSWECVSGGEVARSRARKSKSVNKERGGYESGEKVYFTCILVDE